MNIGIDIDDTIANTYETGKPYLENYIKNILKKELKYDLYDKVDYYNLSKKFGIEPEEEREFWQNYFVSIVKNVVPKKSSVEIINELKEKGNKIILITARFDDGISDIKKITEEWLKENNIVFDKLIIDAQNKLEIAKQEEIDIFIDDSIRNCEMVSSGGIKTYMFSTEINQSYNSNNVVRVKSWDEFYENIKEEI